MNKTAAMLMTAAAAIMAAGSASAFRDESQSVLIWRTMAAKKAEQARPTGPADAPVGTSASGRIRRDPAAHP